MLPWVETCADCFVIRLHAKIQCLKELGVATEIEVSTAAHRILSDLRR